MADNPPKPYHHGDLREQLLLAGEQALAELPIADVTLREIARRAGVSHAAPKHHFQSLADLLGELAARGFDNFVKALNEAADANHDQSPEARLTAMGWAYLRFAENNRGNYALMFDQRDACTMTPHLVESCFVAWMQLENAVGAIIGTNRAGIGAMHVWSSVHGLAMLKAASRLPPHLSPYAVEENTLRMLIAGIKALQ